MAFTVCCVVTNSKKILYLMAFNDFKCLLMNLGLFTRKQMDFLCMNVPKLKDCVHTSRLKQI